MRIALYHNLPSGGAKRAVYEWVSRLAGEHKIDVFTLSKADHEFCDIRPFTQKYIVHPFAPRKLYESPFGRLNQLQRWLDLEGIQQLSRRIAVEINRGGYDVLFANTDIFTFIPALMPYIDIPTLYYMHEPFGPGFDRFFIRSYLPSNTWREAVNRYDPLIWLYRSRLENIQRDSMQHTKRLLSNSRFTQEYIKVAFDVQSHICPLGVDMDVFYPLEGVPKENFVLSVGEMSPRKGFDFIVESLGKIPIEQRPALKLACNTVNHNELTYVKALAESSGVRLELLVNLSVDVLRLLYNKAKLCVYAPVMEPFGLVPLESMACGTPVVAVSEGGVPESVVHEHTGLLVERDPVKFAEAIQRLLSDSALAVKFGRNGREHVLRNWSWEQSSTELVRHLMECAQN